MIVFDASVALKWYFPEAASSEALLAQEEWAGSITGPELLTVEVCAGLVRKANMEKAKIPDIKDIIDDFLGMVANGVIHTRQVAPPIVASASSIALDLGHPLKDCLYLALAMELDCPLLTADARFVERGRPIYPALRLLAET